MNIDDSDKEQTRGTPSFKEHVMELTNQDNLHFIYCRLIFVNRFARVLIEIHFGDVTALSFKKFLK